MNDFSQQYNNSQNNEISINILRSLSVQQQQIEFMGSDNLISTNYSSNIQTQIIKYENSIQKSEKVKISNKEQNQLFLQNSNILNNSIKMRQSKVQKRQIMKMKKRITDIKQTIKNVQVKYFYIKMFCQPKIIFEKQKELKVFIETYRLFLRSVQISDFSNIYNYLYSQKNVMALYGYGKVQQKQHVFKKLNTYYQRWKNNDPFSGFAIENKFTKQFIGYIVFGYGALQGSSQMGLLIRQDQWNKRYGQQAGGAIVLFYSKQIKRRNYKVKRFPFEKIELICHYKNQKSLRMFKRLCANFKQITNMYNDKRFIYEYLVQDQNY